MNQLLQSKPTMPISLPLQYNHHPMYQPIGAVSPTHKNTYGLGQPIPYQVRPLNTNNSRI